MVRESLRLAMPWRAAADTTQPVALLSRISSHARLASSQQERHRATPRARSAPLAKLARKARAIAAQQAPSSLSIARQATTASVKALIKVRFTLASIPAPQVNTTQAVMLPLNQAAQLAQTASGAQLHRTAKETALPATTAQQASRRAAPLVSSEPHPVVLPPATAYRAPRDTGAWNRQLIRSPALLAPSPPSSLETPRELIRLTLDGLARAPSLALLALRATSARMLACGHLMLAELACTPTQEHTNASVAKQATSALALPWLARHMRRLGTSVAARTAWCTSTLQMQATSRTRTSMTRWLALLATTALTIRFTQSHAQGVPG
jgi:hypothetical protein